MIKILFSYLLGCRLAYPVDRFARKEMKQTVISLDLEDIFTMMGENSTKLFSVCRLSADTATALCAEIRTHFAEHEIRPCGRMAVRITAAPGVTLDEIQQILSTIRDLCSEDLIWGFESDDTTDRITTDMLFEVEPS